MNDPLYQDPIGALVRDLCIKIPVSGSLCEDPLDHLYQDLVTGYCRSTCIRSLQQDLLAHSTRIL